MGAMKHMAALLDRAMRLGADRGCTSPVTLFHTDEALGQVVDKAVEMARGMAHGIELNCSMAAECRGLPAGPLGVVVLNGLRNAVEACVQRAAARGRVQLEVTLDDAGQTLLIAIQDAGSVATHDGARDKMAERNSHGIGLSLSHQIVRELGGELGLLIHGENAGATLRLSVPLTRLVGHG
jgi:sensor histidine kinase regulating citrate/malate metabolism